MREWLWFHCPAWLLMRVKLVRRALGVLNAKEIDALLSKSARNSY